MPEAKGQVVNLPELARILGVTPKTIRDMLHMPNFPFHHKSHRRGESHAFDTAEVLAWRDNRIRAEYENRINKNDPRERERNAKAEMVEIELNKARKNLVHVDDVCALAAEQLGAARAIFLAMPDQVAKQLGREAGEIVRKALYAALDEIKIDQERYLAYPDD